MVEPEKPFACTLPDCGMTFTNEDHLHVHTKKHDMVLQLGIEQKAAFVADQTPTPTRFIRNCEEVGLFQDLQNVNPFDEGFKRAIEAKPCLLSLDGTTASTSDDVLHTPQMVFPLMDTSESALFTTNNHRNITISRSSSDESGAVKEYETTTISKLTNEVTTISRIVGKQDIHDKITTTDDVSIIKHEELAQNKDVVNETVSYTTNNVIKIHSNVEIRKDGTLVNIDTSKNVPVTLIYTDSVIKDETSVVTKDVLLTDSNKLQVPEVKMPPIMSQKSLDFVVDSLTSECIEPIHDREKDMQVAKMMKLVSNDDKSLKVKNDGDTKGDDYEVIIKLPNGTQVRMKAVDETKPEKTVVNNETKEKLKKVLSDKADKKSQMDAVIQRIPLENAQIIQNILPVQTGAIIPLTIVNPVNNPILLANNVQKIPITPLHLYTSGRSPRKTVKGRVIKKIEAEEANATNQNSVNLNLQSLTCSVRTNSSEINDRLKNGREKSLMKKRTYEKSEGGLGKEAMDSRCAASKRYRERLKITMKQQSDENQHLKEKNQRLMVENAALKMMITEHLKSCPNAEDLRITELAVE